MQDHLVRILTRDGSVRAAAALTSGLVEEIRRLQGTDPTGSVALGRLVTGAALLGSLLKGQERLALTVEGNGPLGKLFAEADAQGRVRGAVKEPRSGIPPTTAGFDVAAAVGKAGFLHVVKDLGLKEPYRGTVQLYSSTIAQDLAWYLTTSEQVPSSVALGVYVEPDGGVSTAGGFLVQAMPGADPALIPLLEQRLAALPPTTTLLREGLAPVHILERLFAGIPFHVIQTNHLAFRCTCGREQIRAMLRALGPEELRQLAAREEATTVTCEFCRQPYPFTPAELEALAG